MFFESWSGLARILIVGILAYAALVAFLRVSGKRTLSKMNAFDFVVTVAIGSTLATVLVSRQTPLTDGLVALALLIALQLVVAWLSVRAAWFRRIVKSEPQLLFHQGCFLDNALRAERVTREEVMAAARGAGIADLGAVHAVVLETDGSFSVLADAAAPGSLSSLKGVAGRAESGD